MARLTSGSASGADQIDFDSTATSLSGATFSVVVWFKSPDNAVGSDFANIYFQGNDFPGTLSLQMKQSGVVNYFLRDDSSNLISLNSGVVDDGNWHWIFVVKRSNTDHQYYMDGVSQGTSATSVGTYTPTLSEVAANGLNTLPVGGAITRIMLWRRALTLDEARNAAYYGMIKGGGAPGVLWAELGFATTEPDWSGSGNNSTAIGANSTFNTEFRGLGAKLSSMGAGA